MLICKNCNKNFPWYAVVDGKRRSLRRRGYCLECSPFGSKKGYTFKKQQSKSCKKPIKTCAICEREFPYNKNDVCSTCRAKFTRFKSKLKAIELLGGACSSCQSTDVFSLTFHHEDPTKKEFGLADFLGRRKWEEVEVELKKCKLLCASCHMKLHYKMDLLEKICNYYNEPLW